MIPCNMTCLEPDIGTPGLRHLLTTGKCHFSGLLMIPCNMTCLEPDIGTPGLRHLLTTGDAIQTAILSEQRPRLLEMKWDV